MKTIKRFEEIISKRNFDCRIKALNELLNYQGVETSLYKAMILSENIGFHHGKMSFNKFPMSDIPFVFASKANIEEVVFNSLGIDFSYENIDDSQEGWVRMTKLLDEDIPLLVRVEGNFINRLASEEKSQEQGMKISHLSTLLLVGYDDSNVALTEFSSNGRITAFDREKFQKARGATALPYSPEFMCMYIDKSVDARDINENIVSILLNSLSNISRSMINESGESVGDIILEGFSYTDIKIGIPAMEALLSDLKRALDNYNIYGDKVIAFVAQLIRANLSLGGPYSFRNEFGNALKELGEEINRKFLVDAGEEFIKISEAWRKFIFGMRDLAKIDDTKNVLGNCIDILGNIIQCERKQFIELYNYIEYYKQNKEMKDG